MFARISLLSLALVAAGMLSAQETPVPDRCELVLKYWEQVMTTVPALEADVKRTVASTRWGSKEIVEGKIRFLRTPTPRGSLELRRPGDPGLAEKFVVNDDGLSMFDFKEKTVAVLALSKKQAAKGARPIDLPIDPWPIELVQNTLEEIKDSVREGMKGDPTLSLFGANLHDAKTRFDIALKGEDDHYFYLEITPRNPIDTTNFRKARVTLVRTTYLPAQFWRQQDNDDEVQWDLTRVNPQAKLRPEEFAAPTPDGWTRIVSAGSAPTP